MHTTSEQQDHFHHFFILGNLFIKRNAFLVYISVVVIISIIKIKIIFIINIILVATNNMRVPGTHVFTTGQNCCGRLTNAFLHLIEWWTEKDVRLCVNELYINLKQGLLCHQKSHFITCAYSLLQQVEWACGAGQDGFEHETVKVILQQRYFVCDLLIYVVTVVCTRYIHQLR